AIEIVSPSNKDRPESRRAFVARVAALLRRDISVSIVDLVTIRRFNLHADLLELIGGTPPLRGAEAARGCGGPGRARAPPGPGAQAPSRAAAARHLVLSDGGRPAAAHAADLAGHRPARPSRPGDQLRRDVPLAQDRLIQGILLVTPAPNGRSPPGRLDR